MMFEVYIDNKLTIKMKYTKHKGKLKSERQPHTKQYIKRRQQYIKQHIKYYFDAIKKYADFTSRTGRIQYWSFIVVSIFFSYTLQILDTYLFSGGTANIIHIRSGHLSFLYNIFIFLPSISATVRRLHDIGRSGWWYLFFIVTTAASFWLMLVSMKKTFAVITFGIILLLLVVWFIIWLARPSQQGSNRYGKMPDKGF